MNKVIAGAVAGLALGAFSAVSALDMSAGGGAFFTSDFGGGMDGKFSGTIYSTSVAGEVDFKTPFIGGGLYGFYDVTYAEISFGFIGARGEWEENVKMSAMGQALPVSNELTPLFVGLNLGLLLKYPISLSDIITVFPAAGIDYQLVLVDNLEVPWDNEDNPGDLSAPIFKFGVGLDIALGEKMFLRPNLLYGIRLPNKIEKDYLDGSIRTLPVTGINITDDKTRLGHELTFKFGIGYKF